MDEQNQSPAAEGAIEVPVTTGAIKPGTVITGAPLDGVVATAVVEGADPTEEPDALAALVETPAAPPSSGDASAPTPPVSATGDAPAQGVDAADGGAAPSTQDPNDTCGQTAPHPSVEMLAELHEFIGMAPHYEHQGNLPAFVTTARQLVADIQATFG